MRQIFSLLLISCLQSPAAGPPIDREALVRRCNPINCSFNVDLPLTVGNGNFAFSADITGLQTFDERHQRDGIPVETLSRWCWHSEPNPQSFTLADASKNFIQGNGKSVAYPTDSSSPAGEWLRRNPHSVPLGRIRLVYQKTDGKALDPADLTDITQQLDMWSGVIHSSYAIDGVPVKVTTVCHPSQDLVAVKIDSDALASGKLRVEIAFPRGHDLSIKNNPPLDWSQPGSHRTELLSEKPGAIVLGRSIDETRYQAGISWQGGGVIAKPQPHHLELSSEAGNQTLEFSVAFSPNKMVGAQPNFTQTISASEAHWKKHWMNGGAVDFSGSKDSRASAIEKRIILSQYLMATQMSGDVPPQESGLTCNTWYGKHHSEMIWWHTAHFALWGRDGFLKRNLEWYRQRLPEARELAKSRGLIGARWAKMTGPEGRESPGGNPLIIWNQPHLIYLCELLYQNSPDPTSLEQYRDLVFETADCLASMAWLDPDTGNYHLGPPLWIAQEIYDQATSRDPSFELAYWRWALETAQSWRERMKMPRNADWDKVIRHLAPLPQKDGLYVALASHPDTFDNIESRHDHPTMLAPLGLLPGKDVDRETMNRTLDAVLEKWDWKTKIWGWDYPMIAMTATRLDRPEVALEILLRDGPNNQYLPNGHCPQRVDETATRIRKREIPVYLPANGAFLSAVALMVAGWDGCDRQFPGFPNDGNWQIRAEGLKKFP